MTAPGGHRLAFRPDIEGLRGIAVLLVVLYHAGVPWLSGGFVGVDVFFVLSGYLITRLLVDELRRSGTLRVGEFYARRARRLLPAALLVVLATMVASVFIYSPITQLDVAAHAAAAAVYVSNLHFGFEAADYLGGDVKQSPLLHMWSLSVEEQFYLVWPLLLLLAVRLRGLRGALLAAVFVTMGSFAASVWLVQSVPPWAFFGPHSRAWEFGIGALASFLTLRPSRTVSTVGTAAGWLGLASVLSAAVTYSDLTPFPGPSGLVPVFGTALMLVGSALAPASGFAAVLAFRPLQALGRVSYSWYLWHWPALTLTAAAVGGISVPGALLVAVASLGLAVGTLRFVENPLRFHVRLIKSPPRVSLGVFLASSACVAAVALLSGVAADGNLDMEQRLLLAARSDLPRIHSDGCFVAREASEPLDCEYGDPTGSVSVVLWGDSHAAQWAPAVDAVARERGWVLHVHAKSSCHVMFLSPNLDGYGECEAWLSAVEADLAATKPDIVLVAGFARDYELGNVDLVGEYAEVLRRVSLTASATLQVRDNPRPVFDPVLCYSSARSASGSECGFDRTPTLEVGAWEALAAEAAGVPLVDVTQSICPDVTCAARRGDVMVFRDGNHLTASFVQSVAREFSAAVDDAFFLASR